MINIGKLRGKIVEKGFTIRRLAVSIGIDQSTLYRQFENNGKNMSLRVAESIKRTLSLTREEAMDIFFSQ